MTTVENFALGPYAQAKAAYPQIDREVLKTLSEIVGIPPEVLVYWQLDPAIGGATVFLTSLLLSDGIALGIYDGRVTAVDTGIAGSVDPNSVGDHNGRRRRLHSHVERLFERRAQIYVNSPFVDLNDQAFLNWNFAHINTTGAQQGGEATLYTAGDLAPSMALNPYLKVFSANGYYDAVTPFFQTILNFQRIPLVDSHAKNNLTVRNYPSGDMIYLDNES